jgi:catechol 2,3-dioxygenase-like lactoylglutathione lyase family enzyme
MITGLNHFTIVAQDEHRTLGFYCDLLGLSIADRPDLGFPGAWLSAGDGPAVLHIVFGRPPRTVADSVIDHVAFNARGLTAIRTRLQEQGIGHELRRLPGTGSWQMFVRDPDGARVELAFDASEPG